MLPHQLVERLEASRNARSASSTASNYLQRYDIGGGHAFSVSFSMFSRPSMEALGKSRGAHGMRYGFAQQRMRELMHHAEYRLALAIVSEEMGHLRPDSTIQLIARLPPVRMEPGPRNFCGAYPQRDGIPAAAAA